VSRGLNQLDVLLGDWVTESKAYSEGRGFTTVAPTEDGKFLRIESRAEDDRFPLSTQLVGSDESRDECTALYYDSRGVHRVYGMSVADGVWRMWRDAPGLNQRYVGTIKDGGQRIEGRWEMSEDGERWHVDFDLTYRKK
jgi:hypothetical protein